MPNVHIGSIIRFKNMPKSSEGGVYPLAGSHFSMTANSIKKHAKIEFRNGQH